MTQHKLRIVSQIDAYERQMRNKQRIPNNVVGWSRLHSPEQYQPLDQVLLYDWSNETTFEKSRDDYNARSTLDFSLPIHALMNRLEPIPNIDIPTIKYTQRRVTLDGLSGSSQ